MLGRAGLLALVLLLASCTSGSSEGSSEFQYQCTIDAPTADPTFETSDATVYLGGQAFISPGWKHCCPGDPGVSVTVTNLKTGWQGTLPAIVDWQVLPVFGIQMWNPRWGMAVPVEYGDNPLEVIASDPSDRKGRAEIVVRRS